MKLVVLLLALSTPALADEAVGPKLVVGVETTGAFSLTPQRTQGGVGGGLWAGLSLSTTSLLHARAAWLVGLGSHTLFQVGAGWQREGTWRPWLRGGLVLGLGDALNFGQADRLAPNGPTVGLVIGAALLRFQVGRVVVSALEVEGGLSTEFASFGPRVGVTLVSLGVTLGHQDPAGAAPGAVARR